MDHNSQKAWDERALKHGVSFASNDTSEWSAIRRFRTIGKWVSPESVVADVAGGVGMLERTIGPFKRYILLDGSKPALDMSKADRKELITLPEDFERTFEICEEEKVDWIVFCTVFVIPQVLGGQEPEALIRRALKSAKVGVIVTLRNPRWPHEARIRADYPEKMLEALADCCPSIDCSMLPNEYALIVQHPKKDWVSREEALGKIT